MPCFQLHQDMKPGTSLNLLNLKKKKKLQEFQAASFLYILLQDKSDVATKPLPPISSCLSLSSVLLGVYVVAKENLKVFCEYWLVLNLNENKWNSLHWDFF